MADKTEEMPTESTAAATTAATTAAGTDEVEMVGWSWKLLGYKVKEEIVEPEPNDPEETLSQATLVDQIETEDILLEPQQEPEYEDVLEEVTAPPGPELSPTEASDTQENVTDLDKMLQETVLTEKEQKRLNDQVIAALNEEKKKVMASTDPPVKKRRLQPPKVELNEVKEEKKEKEWYQQQNEASSHNEPSQSAKGGSKASSHRSGSMNKLAVLMAQYELGNFEECRRLIGVCLGFL